MKQRQKLHGKFSLMTRTCHRTFTFNTCISENILKYSQITTSEFKSFTLVSLRNHHNPKMTFYALSKINTWTTQQNHAMQIVNTTESKTFQSQCFVNIVISSSYLNVEEPEQFANFLLKTKHFLAMCRSIFISHKLK